MKPSALYFSGLLFITATVGVATTAPTPTPAPELQVIQRLAAGQPVRIACFGDSITGVYYHTGGRRAWCDLVGLGLKQAYPRAAVVMINAGVSGNNTGDALRRMDMDVIQAKPDLVLVMFGMNDVVQIPVEGFRANLIAVTRRAQAAGAEVILMTPTPSLPGDSDRRPEKVAAYAAITRAVGGELGIPVVDTFQAFTSAFAADSRDRSRLMSDSIHPNMRGHKLIAETVVRGITGRGVSLAELPPLQPGLPRILERLQAHERVRIVAMKPFDTLVGPAVQRIFPDARVEITPWDTAGKTLPQIMDQAKALGWSNYRAHPELPTPDLFVVAVPAEADAPNEAEFFHAYTWVMNWSLSFGPPGWDVLVVLPSVASPNQGPAQRTAEDRALEVIQGQDLPWLRRSPGDSSPPIDLLTERLRSLLVPVP